MEKRWCWSLCIHIHWLKCTSFYESWYSKHTTTTLLPVLMIFLPKYRFFPSLNSVTQLCPTLCSPVNCNTPGFPVHHQLRELAQTQVHWVGDAIQPSYPLMSPSPPALSLSQHPHQSSYLVFSLSSFNNLMARLRILKCSALPPF